jgi:CDP-diacylglycerol pyrophosphatase
MNVQVDPKVVARTIAPDLPGAQGRARTGRRVGRAAGFALLALVALCACAAGRPRDLLWRIEQSCLLDHRLTGSSFPCLDVDPRRGIAVFRPPLRRSHIVAMPLVPLSGVEAPELLAGDGPNYFQAAWEERHVVQAEMKRPLAWNDLGLAVNSKATRSQDQLHIHIDCVRKRVRQALSERFGPMQSEAWQPGAFVFQRQSYWVRRLRKPSLDGINVFALAHDIPQFRDNPAMTVLAVVGISDQTAGDGFLLLAGQSDPARGAAQSTSEDLLDHSCSGAAP